MYSLSCGDIVPGESIGWIRLGMSFHQITQTITEYDVEDLPFAIKMICGDVRIWFDKCDITITQILVCDGFTGRYAGHIGLGSTLADVQRLLHATWHEDLDTYVIDGAEGMCFELGDTPGDDWDEMNAPIEFISVYR